MMIGLTVVTYSCAGVVWHILISHVHHGYGEAGPILVLVVCGHLKKEISTLWYRELL